MKHDLESGAMRLLGDVRGLLVMGQNGNGEGITQSEDGCGRSSVAAEIVDNDGEPRGRRFPAGILRSFTGCECRARNNFDFYRRHACVTKLEVKQIPRLSGWILRQMISGRYGI